MKDKIAMLENKQSHINLLGNRFKIEDELLGFGSFGRTYLGKDIKKNKNVAIKIVIIEVFYKLIDVEKEVDGLIFKRSHRSQVRKLH